MGINSKGLILALLASSISLTSMAQRGGTSTGRVEQRPGAARPVEQTPGNARVREAEAQKLKELFDNFFNRADAVPTVPGVNQSLNLNALRPAVQATLNSSRTLTVNGQEVSPRELIRAVLAFVSSDKKQGVDRKADLLNEMAALGAVLAAVADTEPRILDPNPAFRETLELAQQALAKQLDIIRRILEGFLQVTPQELADHIRVVKKTIEHFMKMGSAAYGNEAYYRAIKEEVLAANDNSVVSANDSRVIAKLRQIINCQ